MRRVLVVLTISFLLTSQALAWSDAGHKIIASIAFMRLTDDERDHVIDILREHPRFGADFDNLLPRRYEKGEGDALEWVFQQAAVCPISRVGSRARMLNSITAPGTSSTSLIS
jgi:hypothetical protein